MTDIPTATLCAITHPTSPPKLVGFAVMVDGRAIAVVQTSEMVSAATLSGLAAELEKGGA